MKVSKPVLIFGIVVLLIAGYIFFFTGKKKAPAPPAPPPAAAGQTQQATPAQTPVPSKIPTSEPGAKSGQPEATPPAEKPQFDKLQTGWVKNPFVLPQFKETKKVSTGTAIRLSAIFEKGKDRVAIIDREVVRAGDMVGDEKVLEIGRDKVILIRNNIRRVLSLANIEDTVREEEPKTKATEKGK
ncbi:MAG: hypothetical protein C0399_06370 [Syntrophus sp. (in: bacteria)]|nr:hypothetical protein [Syntrophus sp. (in: bacteria)]